MERFGIMSIRKTDIYERVFGLAWQLIDESVLILEPKKKKAHELNPVASYIWSELDGERSVSDIVEAVSKEYSVDKSLIEEEVVEFFETLSSERLIECL